MVPHTRLAAMPFFTRSYFMLFPKTRLASALLSSMLLLGMLNSSVSAAPSASAVETPAAQTLPLNDLRTFAEVLERIKTAYVEPIDDKTLFENADRKSTRLNSS